MVTDNDETSPEGLQNAFTLNDTSSGAYYRIERNVSVSAGDNTLSVFLKKTTGALSHYAGVQLDSSRKYVIIDTTNGTWNEDGTNPTNDFIDVEDFSADYWRVIIRNNLTAGSKRFALWPALSTNGSVIAVGATGANTFYGVQLEQGSYPTSYIPNHSGGTITRGAETSLVTDIDSLFGSNNTFYSEFIYYTSNTSTFLEVNQNGGAANLLQISATSSNKINYTIFANGAFVASRSTNVVLTDGVMKVALKYDGINYKVFLNGSLIDTYAQTSIPVSLNRIYCGNARGAQQFGKGISQTLLFPETLSDADCIAITTL